jgi:hypothetical protein
MLDIFRKELDSQLFIMNLNYNEMANKASIYVSLYEG